MSTDTESPSEEVDDGYTWDYVRNLFASQERGTTTEAYNVASNILTTRYDFLTVRDSGAVYHFDPDKGYYVSKGETFIEELLQEHLAGELNTTRVRNIRDQVIADNYVDSDEFHPPEGKVCVENGVLDLETRDVEDHSPGYYFTSRLNVAYDADATTDRWQDFLEESVDNPEDGKKLEEFIGYALESWNHNREKNLFVVGPSRSGKSTFADVVKSLFGSQPAVVNLTPQQLADTQFDVASLKEAMFNVVNDINASKIEDTGKLKRIFSGEPLKLEKSTRTPISAPRRRNTSLQRTGFPQSWDRTKHSSGVSLSSSFPTRSRTTRKTWS